MLTASGVPEVLGRKYLLMKQKMKNILNLWKLIGLLTILLISILACERSDDTLPSPEHQNSNEQILSNALVNDEFADYGLHHNLYLDYLATMPNFNTTSRESLLNHSSAYSGPIFSGRSVQWEDHEENMNFVYTLIEEPESLIDNLLSTEFIDSTEIELATMLHSVLLGSLDETFESYQNVNQFVSSVNTLENYIRSNYSVVYDSQNKTGNSAARFLAACSIAKSSYSYWLEAATSTSHPWHIRFNTRKTYEFNGQFNNTVSSRSFFGKIARAIKVAASDVWGFVAAEGCGSADAPGGYNLGCAWNNAGEKSGDAGDRHDARYGNP